MSEQKRPRGRRVYLTNEEAHVVWNWANGALAENVSEDEGGLSDAMLTRLRNKLEWFEQCKPEEGEK